MENYVLMSRSSKFIEKFEFVECTKWWKFNGKSKNTPNHEIWMENYVH